MQHSYFVYVLASDSRELYIGITNNLARRLAEHRAGHAPLGHAFRHSAKHLVYFEHTNDVRAAITREKQLKGWKRRKKIELIEGSNPDWVDLSEDWY